MGNAMRIGFMGLGHMGSKMAARILNAGFDLHVYNRTPSAAHELIQKGAKFSPSPVDLSNCDVIISMLSDDEALRSVLFQENGLFASLKPGTIHLSMSTISPSLADKLDQEHRSRDCIFIGAPVFGRPDAAEAGKLFIIAGGESSALERCQKIFEVLSQKVFVVSQKPSHAHLTKVLGNFMLISTIQILSESLALAKKSGLEQTSFLEAMTGSLFSAPIYKNYGTMIVEQLYDKKVGFRLPLALKDIRLAQQTSESAQSPMPTASLVHDQILTAIARGLQEMDMSALGKLAADNSGLHG